MVSYEDVLLRIRGQDDSGSAFGSAQQRIGALKTMAGAAITAASTQMLSFAKDAVDAAMAAEQGWMQFGNVVDNNGGNWEAQSEEMKKWVSDYSNSMGRSVADTRAAMTTYMNMGMTFEESQKAMEATSNYAAQMGITQEEAAGKLQKAFMGNGRALKELGLNIDDYKDSTTGAIDKERLLADVMQRTHGAAGEYADSTAGKFQKMNNTIASLKTDFGATLIDAIQPLIPIVQGFLNVINSLPGPVKTAGFAAIALGAGVGIIAGPLMSVIGLMETLGITLPTVSGLMRVLGTETAATTAEQIALAAAEAGLTAEELGAAAAHATGGTALLAEGAAAAGASGGFWSMAAAELAALWPILAIIAAVAAVVVVVEQIGEALGWWTDFSTMLEAIRAGVQRLWEAFINSPQVQGAIKAVQSALQALWNFIQPVFAWISAAWNNLFKSDGAGSGGPDVVGQIINIFGKLGEIASWVFGMIQKGFQAVMQVMQPLINGVQQIVGVFQQLTQGTISWQDAAMQILTIIGQAFYNFAINAGQLAMRIGTALFNGIVTYGRQLPGAIWNLLTQVGSRVVQFAGILGARARALGIAMLNGIVNYVRQLPARVGAFMMQLPGRIAAAASAAVSAAVSLASQLVTAVGNGVMGVAQAVFNEFIKIGDKIREAVSSAVQAALNFGNDLKNAVLSALGIASPGIIQRKIAIEFQDIPGRIAESEGYVYNAARSYASNITSGFNTPPINHANLSAYRLSTEYTGAGGGANNRTVINIHEGAIQLDARNLTTAESKQVLINALEGLDQIKNIQVGG